MKAEDEDYYRRRLADELAAIACAATPATAAAHRILADAYRAILRRARDEAEGRSGGRPADGESPA